MAGDDRGRLEKIERVFRHFDADGDGVLVRREMAALVVALNPRLRFTMQQINRIVHDVFRLYSKTTGGTGPRRVTLGALLCIYDDIADDVYRDFDTLGLGHLFRDTAADGSQSQSPSGQEWRAASPDSLPSTECSSLASSTASSPEIDLFECELGPEGAAPMSEYEEIPSFRWLSPSLYPRIGGGHPPVAVRNPNGGGGNSREIREPSTDSQIKHRKNWSPPARLNLLGCLCWLPFGSIEGERVKLTKKLTLLQSRNNLLRSTMNLLQLTLVIRVHVFNMITNSNDDGHTSENDSLEDPSEESTS